jgi:hypothetical protein
LSGEALKSTGFASFNALFDGFYCEGRATDEAAGGMLET